VRDRPPGGSTSALCQRLLGRFAPGRGLALGRLGGFEVGARPREPALRVVGLALDLAPAPAGVALGRLGFADGGLKLAAAVAFGGPALALGLALAVAVAVLAVALTLFVGVPGGLAVGRLRRPAALRRARP